MRSLIWKLVAARKLTFFKFKLFSHGEQSFWDYTVSFVVLKFCDIHKTRFSGNPLKTENVVIWRNFGSIFQSRMNLIMPQNIISFSLHPYKLNVTNTYIKVTLIDTWQYQ